MQLNKIYCSVALKFVKNLAVFMSDLFRLLEISGYITILILGMIVDEQEYVERLEDYFETIFIFAKRVEKQAQDPMSWTSETSKTLKNHSNLTKFQDVEKNR